MTLIGDAAHAMTPEGREGVNQAFIDAQQLSQQILSLDIGEDRLERLDKGVRTFENDMFERTRKAAQLSIDLTRDCYFITGDPKSALARAISRYVNHTLPPALHPFGRAGVRAHLFFKRLLG